MEKIYLISNPYTIPKEFQKNKPVSYNYYKFQKSLENRGLSLLFVNQDDNHVYFRVKNNVTGDKTCIMSISYNELKNFDVRLYYQQIMEEIGNGKL